MREQLARIRAAPGLSPLLVALVEEADQPTAISNSDVPARHPVQI